MRSCARGSHRLAGAGASKRARGSGSADRGQCRLPPPPPPHPSAGPAQLEQRHLHPSRSPPAAVIQGPAIAAGPAYRRRWVRRGSNRLLHRRPVVALRLAVVQRLGLEGLEVLSHLLREVRKRRRSWSPPSLAESPESPPSLSEPPPSFARQVSTFALSSSSRWARQPLRSCRCRVSIWPCRRPISSCRWSCKRRISCRC